MKTTTVTTSEQANEITGAGNNLTQNTEHAAIAYAACGLSVIPVKQDKTPGIDSWNQYQQTIASETAIHEWFSPSISGVGIVCGVVSGKLECLDIDEKYNTSSTPLVDQFTSLVEAQVSGLSSRLVHETSMNGGHHFVYRCSTIHGNRVLVRREPSAQELEADKNARSKTLIETRGEGGHFVRYPTPRYIMIAGSFTNIPEITEQERGVLLDCAKALNLYNREEKTVTGYTEKRRVSIVRPGDDFNLRGDISTILNEAGWKPVYTKDQTQHWRRPGKSEGISATFNNHPNMFYVFSSNCDPLEQGTWYTKFSVLGLLKYNGDFGAAAQDLAEQGYGDTEVAKTEGFLNQFYEFRFNEVTGRSEFKSKEGNSFHTMSDYDLNSIKRKHHYSHMKISKENLAHLLQSEYSHAYNPFIEYYESLTPWDKSVDYITQLASTVTLKDPAGQGVYADYLKK